MVPQFPFFFEDPLWFSPPLSSPGDGRSHSVLALRPPKDSSPFLGSSPPSTPPPSQHFLPGRNAFPSRKDSMQQIAQHFPLFFPPLVRSFPPFLVFFLRVFSGTFFANGTVAGLLPSDQGPPRPRIIFPSFPPPLLLQFFFYRHFFSVVPVSFFGELWIGVDDLSLLIWFLRPLLNSFFMPNRVEPLSFSDIPANFYFCANSPSSPTLPPRFLRMVRPFCHPCSLL